MAEVVGLIASIGTLAGAGFKLANIISTISDGWTVANEQVKMISADTRAVAIILHQIKKRLEQTAATSASGTISKEVGEILRGIITVCQADIDAIERSLVPLLVSEGPGMMFKQKVLWLLSKSKIAMRRASLESIKGTLHLFLNTWDLTAENELGGYLHEEVKQLVGQARSIRKLFVEAERIDQTLEKALEDCNDSCHGPHTHQPSLQSSEPEEAGTIAMSDQTAVESEASTIGDLVVRTQIYGDSSSTQPSPQMTLESISGDHFILIADHMRLDRSVMSMALVALQREPSADAPASSGDGKSAERSSNTSPPPADVPDSGKTPGSSNPGDGPYTAARKDRQSEHKAKPKVRDFSQTEATWPPPPQASYVPPEYSSMTGSDSGSRDENNGDDEFGQEEGHGSSHAPYSANPGFLDPTHASRPSSETVGQNYIYHDPRFGGAVKTPPTNPYFAQPYLPPQLQGPQHQPYGIAGMYGGPHPSGYWGSVPPDAAPSSAPPERPKIRTPQKARPKDAETSKLEAELAALKLDQQKKEQQQKIREFEYEIRRKTEEEYKVREEARRKAMEEAKKEFERAKGEAEREARGKLEQERKDEAQKAKAHAEMLARIQREAKNRYEAEILAKQHEADLLAREKYVEEILAKKKKKGLRRFCFETSEDDDRLEQSPSRASRHGLDEIRLIITSSPFRTTNPPLPQLPLVCREWNSYFSHENFRVLMLDQHRFDDFKRYVCDNRERRDIVQTIVLCVELPKYDCRVCQKPEDETTAQINDALFLGTLGALMKMLSLWAARPTVRGRDPGIILDIGAYSPSDGQHALRDFRLSSGYRYGACQDAYEAHEASLQQARLDAVDECPGWQRTCEGKSPLVGTKRRLLATLCCAESPWVEDLCRDHSFPPVPIITDLFIRRHYYRHISPYILGRLIEKGLPRLLGFRHETWAHPWSGGRTRFQHEYLAVCEAVSSTLLRNLSLVCESSKHLKNIESGYHSGDEGRDLGTRLAQLVWDKGLTTLNVSFMIDAWDLITPAHPPFVKLTILTLTAKDYDQG